MNETNDWKRTSELGFKFEDFCLKDINDKKYPLAYKNLKKDELSYYDIILFDGNFGESHQQKTIECKFDEVAHETGNICIETGCNGRWSGLFITKADYWLIADGHDMYLIKKDNIRKCIDENMDVIMIKRKFPVKQEDGVVKEMDLILIPKRVFTLYCLEVGTMNNMKYEKL
jgi:hypothetical protein